MLIYFCHPKSLIFQIQNHPFKNITILLYDRDMSAFLYFEFPDYQFSKHMSVKVAGYRSLNNVKLYFNMR